MELESWLEAAVISHPHICKAVWQYKECELFSDILNAPAKQSLDFLVIVIEYNANMLVCDVSLRTLHQCPLFFPYNDTVLKCGVRDPWNTEPFTLEEAKKFQNQAVYRTYMGFHKQEGYMIIPRPLSSTAWQYPAYVLPQVYCSACKKSMPFPSYSIKIDPMTRELLCCFCYLTNWNEAHQYHHYVPAYHCLCGWIGSMSQHLEGHACRFTFQKCCKCASFRISTKMKVYHQGPTYFASCCPWLLPEILNLVGLFAFSHVFLCC